jgi:hypothetical protein
LKQKKIGHKAGGEMKKEITFQRTAAAREHCCEKEMSRMMSRIFSYYLVNGEQPVYGSESGQFLRVTTCMKAAHAKLLEAGPGATHARVIQKVPGKRRETVVEYQRNAITGRISLTDGTC